MKTSSLVLVLSLLLTVATPALAVDNRLKNMRQEIKNKKEEIRTERKEMKDISLENRRTKAQSTVNRLKQGIENRYSNILKQKTNIENRIAKIEAANTAVPTPTKIRDMTAAKAKLAQFSDVKYKSDLEAFNAKTAELLASSTPLKLTPELKALAKTLDADLKAMRQNLADTLRLMIRAR